MTDLNRMGQKAVDAKYVLGRLTKEEKNRALEDTADALSAEQEKILTANAKDIEAGEAGGMHPGLLDRLRLTKERIEAMAEGLREIAALEDPVGEVMESFTRPNGLKIEKRRDVQ